MKQIAIDRNNCYTLRLAAKILSISVGKPWNLSYQRKFKFLAGNKN